MTSLARLPSLMIRPSACRAFSKSDGWAASQREQDDALVTIAPSG
jgi:hypothetical protein